jgi:hypothetical protein
MEEFEVRDALENVLCNKPDMGIKAEMMVY